MKKIICFTLSCLFIHCTTTSPYRSTAQRKAQVVQLVKKIKANVDDADSWRELGIMLYNAKMVDKARLALERAFRLNNEDPKTLFYFGMSSELSQKDELAIHIYRRYSKLPFTSKYRSWMKARYDILNQKAIRRDLKHILSQENLLTTEGVSPKAIAVLPFTYQGEDESYASLSRGLCEMMITDLSQVEGLELVERARMQALMDELTLSGTGLVESDSAPRMGKLLSAGQVLNGAYDVLEGEKFRMNVELWNLVDMDVPPVKANTEDGLKNLFRLEKMVVFSVIRKMGIELTPQQKKEIMHVPTRNIQAFMAYSTGLAQQDAGQFNQAAASFQRALQLDPNFQPAGQMAQENQILTMADNDLDLVAQSVEATTMTDMTPVDVDLIGGRLENVVENLGVSFEPGVDNREPTQEAAGSGANVGLADLPLPPAPPRRNQ